MNLKEFFKNFIAPDFNPTEVQKRIMEILDEHVKWDKENQRPKGWTLHLTRRGKFSTGKETPQTFPRDNGLKPTMIIIDDPIKD